MEGFGIDVKDPNRYGDEDDARICSHEMSRRRPGEGPHRHGERAAEMPGRQRRLHDQRAGRRWRMGSAEGRRQGRRQRADRLDRRRLPGRGRTSRRASSARPRSSIRTRWLAMALEAIASGQAAEIDPAVGFLDTGATLHHGEAGRWRSLDLGRGRPESLCWGCSPIDASPWTAALRLTRGAGIGVSLNPGAGERSVVVSDERQQAGRPQGRKPALTGSAAVGRELRRRDARAPCAPEPSISCTPTRPPSPLSSRARHRDLQRSRRRRQVPLAASTCRWSCSR